jgi:hypothetical protein
LGSTTKTLAGRSLLRAFGAGPAMCPKRTIRHNPAKHLLNGTLLPRWMGMMGATARIILLTLAVGLASGAKAEPDINSANYRLPACKAFVGRYSNERSFVSQGVCAGLVSGVAWTIGNGGLAGACAHIPAEVTVDQEIQVVVRYVEARPNRLHEPSPGLALEALVDAWPCRDAKMAPKR